MTIENVQEQSHNLWRYQRFLLVNEFRKKSLLPPPFNTFNCLIAFIGDMIKRARNSPRVPQENFVSVKSTSNATDGQLRSNRYHS